MSVQIPPGQDDAFSAVLSECNASVGEPPRDPVTAQNARAVFDASVIDHACLVAEGLSIPDPPSFDWYWDEFQRREAPPWDPFVDATWDPDYRAAFEVCRS